jgi:hypothetical protein
LSKPKIYSILKRIKMETKEPKGERVRKNTSAKSNERIDKEIISNIDKYTKMPQSISARIVELDKEWDIERVLEINMSTLSIIGLVLAITINIFWLILPGVVLLFFVQHALQGWCPPIPVFRHFNIRTRPEIDREKYALKAIRGDFNLSSISSGNAQAAFQAVQKI